MSQPRRAVASRLDGYTHEVQVRNHSLTADEPVSNGGSDRGPTPQELLAASLASCTAITIEMYADRKGWDLGKVEVVAEFEPGARGECDSFEVTLRLPKQKELTGEQVDRLKLIAGKCPVHRTLAREAAVQIDDRVELV